MLSIKILGIPPTKSSACPDVQKNKSKVFTNNYLPETERPVLEMAILFI